MSNVVLFVDDDPNILRAFMRSFHNQNFEFFTARSAEEAIGIFKRHHVDVIVSDESMPGMNGTELLGWVSQNFPEVKRIILTGQPTFPSMEKAINDCGVSKYLSKPIDHAELASAIMQL
ncbi:MAG: response regulator [Planctomycetota bacterium]